eukprot:m.660865 g.660865  ORF g.660865 m.660865 type:complete len:170 (+) comp22732_c0_seq4:514-1023(+)
MGSKFRSSKISQAQGIALEIPQMLTLTPQQKLEVMERVAGGHNQVLHRTRSQAAKAIGELESQVDEAESAFHDTEKRYHDLSKKVQMATRDNAAFPVEKVHRFHTESITVQHIRFASSASRESVDCDILGQDGRHKLCAATDKLRWLVERKHTIYSQCGITTPTNSSVH